MPEELLSVAAGLGFFLLGMVVMTEGLRALAERRIRALLARFTRSPVSGVVAGALATALIQSSSATAVVTVGFVSAGLLSFTNSLGILFGANIGTTITGWLVAILGFKLDLGRVVLPLVLLGILLRLFGRGRLADVGWFLAGFALLFVGIDALKEGMAHLEGVVTPASFPDDTLFGRVQLVGIGFLITLVTQSSSAGVAAALAAIGAGAISFPQAAAMVIGMDVSTTLTALLATVGGSVATRRTGMAHVVYNGFTGVMAFFLLDAFIAVADGLLEGGVAARPQLSLVAFHTTFNAIGVLAVLPLTRPFAALVIRLIPERGPRLTRRLDRRLASDAVVAAEAARATACDVALETFGVLADRLEAEAPTDAGDSRLARIEEAVTKTRQFSEFLARGSGRGVAKEATLSVLHCVDHLSRLHHRAGQVPRIHALRHERGLDRLREILRQSLLSGRRELRDGDAEAAAERFDRLRQFLRRRRRARRQPLLAGCLREDGDTDLALLRLDALRWLHRVAYHAWRIAAHLAEGADARDVAPREGSQPP